MTDSSANESDRQPAEVHTRLVLFSGPPGVGKSTMSSRLARHTGWAILARDQVDRTFARLDVAHAPTVGYELLFDLTELQLWNGVSVILDAVFPRQPFRLRAADLAAVYEARFDVVFCRCSDRDLWRRRVARRPEVVPGWTPADWDEVRRVEAYYEPWTTPHLALDAAHPLDANFAVLLRYLGVAG